MNHCINCGKLSTTDHVCSREMTQPDDTNEMSDESITGVQVLAKYQFSDKSKLLSLAYQVKLLTQENAKLTAEVERHTKYQRANIEETTDGCRICFGDHEKSSDCGWVELIRKDKVDSLLTTQAELVKALEELFFYQCEACEDNQNTRDQALSRLRERV